MPSYVNSENIKRHLSKIAVPRDIFTFPENLSEVQSYIEDEFRKYGYLVEKFPFRLQNQTFENVIAIKPGASPQQKLIIGAHFDGIEDTPGADDNASGVAALLEIAMVLAKDKTSEQIEFAAFNAEEYGLAGSTCYARHLKEKNISLRGMLSLEMIGYTSDSPESQGLPVPLKGIYPDKGNFIAIVGCQDSTTLLETVEKNFRQIDGLPVESLSVPEKGLMFPEVRLSDHSPFWDEDYPALLITDTSFFRNPHYHTVKDTVETLNLAFLTKVADAVVHFCRNSL